jgi:hypothetical protein
MTVNAPLDPDRLPVAMPRPSVDVHKTQWVIRFAFIRFDVDHRGGKAAPDLQTMPLHFRRPSAVRSTRQCSA